MIYYKPQNGQIYFIKGKHLREFGFPRKKLEKEKQKDFKWKKTNFVTDLPKQAAIVRYLVAKSKFEGKLFFMHAAVLKSEYNKCYRDKKRLE